MTRRSEPTTPIHGDSSSHLKSDPVDTAAVLKDTPHEASRAGSIITGTAGVAGEAIAPEGPTTIVIWSVLSSARVYNVPISLPKTEKHGPTIKIDRVAILPGENVLPRTTWEEMKNLTYYKRLLDEEVIGEGPMPRVHQKNAFDRDANGRMTMAPASKKDIGILCPKSRETVANHAARVAGDHMHIRVLDERELAKAGYSSGQE